MTDQDRNPRTAEDARRAEALAILAKRPTESAEQSLHRSHRQRLLAIVALVVVIVAVAMTVALILVGSGGGSDRDEDVPSWLVVVGFSLSGLGLVIMTVGTVVQFRRMRGTHGWDSPLNVLTFRRRHELVEQRRGSSPVVPERAPLVGHLAEMQMAQRVALMSPGGLLLSFAGLWIAGRSATHLVLIVVLGAVLLTGAAIGRRETERARRFLEQHPTQEHAS